MSTALVTGGSGFLGSHVADTLTARGCDVTIIDRKPSPYLQPGQTMVVGDILDARALAAAAAGCDAVFHLAGPSDGNEPRTHPVDTVTANLVGTPGDTRECVHVEDAARLSVDVLAPEFANQHLVITGQHAITLERLFTMFSEILGRSLDIEYAEPPEGPNDARSRATPDAISPRVGRKLTATSYVDMNQGLLQMLEQLNEERSLGGTPHEDA